MRKYPPSDQVKHAERQAVRNGENQRSHDAVPARRHHQVKGQVTDRIKIALRACREKILPEPTREQFEGNVIVIVEEVPIEVLAGVDCPRRAKQHRKAKREGEVPCWHAALASALTFEG